VIESAQLAARPRLGFLVKGIEAIPAATPQLALKLKVSSDLAVRGLALTVKVRIAAQRRRHSTDEVMRLTELFGPYEQWSRSLGPVPWTQGVVNVGPFEESTVVEVPLPCSYDFEIASAKYLAALEDGRVPLELLFSGALFYSDDEGRLQTTLIPWEHEAHARLPVAVWREAVDAAFPDSAWLRVDRALFARLQAHRSQIGATSWDEAIESLLAGS
jgi:hypothetical protein